MTEIRLDIPQELMDQLTQFTPGDTIPQLALAALQEWTAWLSGEFRPMSMSELETERIFVIYNSVLVDELPSVDNLGQRFGLPMGRARYILQSLAYRKGRFLYKRQIEAITHSLDQGQWSDDRKTCTVTLDRGCAAIIDRVFNELLANRRISSVVKGVAMLDGIRYDLGSGHQKELKSYFETLLKNQLKEQ
jgi:hypothetical protein